MTTLGTREPQAAARIGQITSRENGKLAIPSVLAGLVSRGPGGRATGVSMRPKLAMWSDYGAPARKHWTRASKRGTRRSIGPKIFLAAVSVVAGVIGISGIYPQIIDAEWVQGAAGTRLSKIAPPTTEATTKQSSIAATIPPPSRRATAKGRPSVSAPGAASAPEPSQSVEAVEPPAETASPLPLAAIPDAEAKADVLLADPMVAAAKPGNKPADKLRVVAMARKKVVRVERHQRGHSRAYAQYGGGWGGGGWSGFQPFGNRF